MPKGLTPGEQKQPVFYGRGDVVSFRRELAPHQQDRLEKNTPYRVAGIDQHGGRLQLQKDDGSFVIWRPGSCGARDAEVYTARAAPARRRRPHHLDQEPAGDRRRQRPDGHRHRGASGQGQLHRRAEAGRQTTLEASSAEARHLEHGYAQTAQKLQGQTAERALIHAEHWRLNLINQRSFYVLLSRAKDGVTIATSDRAGLIDAIRERSGEQQAALDQLEARQAPEIARAAMQEVTQERERQRQQEREQQQQRERALHSGTRATTTPARTSPAGGMPISARNAAHPPPTGSAITTTTWATDPDRYSGTTATVRAAHKKGPERTARGQVWPVPPGRLKGTRQARGGGAADNE